MTSWPETRLPSSSSSAFVDIRWTEPAPPVMPTADLTNLTMPFASTSYSRTSTSESVGANDTLRALEEPPPSGEPRVFYDPDGSRGAAADPCLPFDDGDCLSSAPLEWHGRHGGVARLRWLLPLLKRLSRGGDDCIDPTGEKQGEKQGARVRQSSRRTQIKT